MSFYENIFGYITDRSKNLSTRATVFILVIFCLIGVDNIVGFSHYYNKQRQLDQLILISTLLRDSLISQDIKNELLELEKRTFKRKTILDYSGSFFKEFSKNKKTSPKNEKKDFAERNDIWFLISASGFYILIAVLTVPVLLLTNKEMSFFKLLASIIILLFVMVFTSWFNYWLFDKIIPDRIFGSWTWNYIINFVLQIGFVVGILNATNTINKTNVSS